MSQTCCFEVKSAFIFLFVRNTRVRWLHRVLSNFSEFSKQKFIKTFNNLPSTSWNGTDFKLNCCINNLIQFGKTNCEK